jgi:hypothetical protein
MTQENKQRIQIENPHEKKCKQMASKHGKMLNPTGNQHRMQLPLPQALVLFTILSSCPNPRHHHHC